jgi:hypothetical protein
MHDVILIVFVHCPAGFLGFLGFRGFLNKQCGDRTAWRFSLEPSPQRGMAFQIPDCAAQQLTLRQMRELLDTGMLFCPAYRHYTTDSLSALRVVCDNCGAAGLAACIGKDAADLCLACAAKLVAHIQQAPFTLFVGLHKTYAQDVAKQLGIDLCTRAAAAPPPTAQIAAYIPNALVGLYDDDDVVVSVHKW